MSILDQYDKAFGNLDEVYPPAIWGSERFLAMAKDAVDRGVPLTLAAVQRELPEAHFEELKD